nr:MAG TPA: L SHAPED TAIL FIBER PROTEIN [Caudoviricetes sp.]
MQITLDEGYNAMCDFVYLGYVGEVNAREISVLNYAIPEATAYKLKIEYPDKTVYELPIKNGMCSLGASIFKTACEVKCQIIAYAVEGEVYKLVRKSDIFKQEIRSSIDESGIPSYEESLDALDKILQYESNSKEYAERAEQARDTAVSAKERAVSAENTTVQKADEADKSAQSAKNSEQNAAKSAERAEGAEERATAGANQAQDYAKEAGKSADSASSAANFALDKANRAETAKTAAETSAAQSETARQGAENARQQAVTSQNNAKISAAQAATSAQQTEADKTITTGYAKTAKTCADSTTADRQAVQEMAEQVTADKTTVADNAAKVAEDRAAAETAAQTAQSIADSLPEDYTTAVGKIAENTAEIANVKLTDKELTRRVNALYDMGQGITHRFETDSDTAYQKAVPTGAKLMSVKSVGGRSIMFNQMANVADIVDETFDFYYSEVLFSGNRPKWTKGHKYLFEFYVKSNIEPFTTSIGYSNKESVAYNLDGESFSNVVTGRKLLLFTPDDSLIDSGYQYIGLRPVRYDTQKRCTISVKNLMIFDLTSMFGSGKEPSTVEEFEAMFPNEYYPYNAGEVVSAGTESIIEQGKNLFDYTDKTYNGANISKVENGVIYTKGLTTTVLNIPTVVGSKYTLSFKVKSSGANQGGLRWSLQKGKNTSYAHDSSLIKSEVGYAANAEYQAVATFVATTDFVSLCTIMLMVYDVQLENGDIATDYSPFYQTEYLIPEAIKALPGYGWSAGTARNYVDYENKKYYQCVGNMDLGTLNWAINSTSLVGEHFYGFVDPGKFKRLGMFQVTVHNILCSKYMTVARNQNVFVDKTITLDGDSTAVSQIQVKDTAYTDTTAFKQAMSGVILYYELEDPIVTDISSLIPDDFLRNIEVEAGGSITFKNGNDDYRIPVPNEEEYVVKLSEVGGTT